ncbi:hypothetical protein Plhal304r1_c049g0131521 [Plasmopara halstedii]
MSLVTYHFSPIGALPISKPQPTFVIGPTVSPTSASRLSIFAILNQDEPTDNLKVSTTMGLQDNRHKAALSFILSSSDAKSEIDQRKTRMRELRHESAGVKRMRYVKEIPESPQLTLTRPSASKHEGKKGSKFCSVEGCSSRAKHAKRCWKHGGWVRCKVLDCTNRAKCKGVCWSHGGGTVCSFKNCYTIAVSNGFCWAHGGGKRCQVSKCSKPAYERTQNYCQTHYEEAIRY